MKRATSLLLILLFAMPVSVFAGIGSHSSLYVGGTVSSIPKGADGKLLVDDPAVPSFQAKKADWKIPYDKITALSYGQHAGRRVGTTVALGVTTLGVGALPILFSKKRRHYLTIEYTDQSGTAQAAIFELGKDAIRTTMKTIEVRSGKKVQYEDEEARKSGNK
jgi:methenyltetrahydromethanopterin cyclohydrolase